MVLFYIFFVCDGFRNNLSFVDTNAVHGDQGGWNGVMVLGILCVIEMDGGLIETILNA